MTHVADLALQATEIARVVRSDGGRALVVGGFVRDRLLGRASRELDIEVFGIPAERLPALLSRLGRVEAVGQAFPVYKIGASTWRCHGASRRPGADTRASPSPAIRP